MRTETDPDNPTNAPTDVEAMRAALLRLIARLPAPHVELLWRFLMALWFTPREGS